MKAFVVTAKHGDIITALPIIHNEFKITGRVQSVVTCEAYGEIFSGCSYVRCVLSNFRWDDLRSAIRLAKESFDEITILQTHGENFPFEQTQRSFQHEVYLRAGCIKDWGKLELVFDRRNFDREFELVKELINEKFILVGDKSESSEFHGVKDLISMIQDEFGKTHKIIMLSTIKAEKIFDLLGLCDLADALVTIDTVHAHLSQASKIPKFILSADGWRGTAWRKNFQFYSKYAEWPERSKSLIASLKNCVYGNQKPEPVDFKTNFQNGYNLSIVKFQGEKISAYRFHPAKDWKTRLVICDGKSQSLLKIENEDSAFSYEDLRLIESGGKLFGFYTISAASENQFQSKVSYGEITKDGDGWRVGNNPIRYPGNDFTTMQKNWTPFVFESALHVIHGISGDAQVVLRLDRDMVLSEHHSPAPVWAHGEIRGGTIINRGDTLLRFFHSRTEYANRFFRYHIGACVMDAKPPFSTLAISKHPIISGDEEFFSDCHHYKGNVSICYGAIQEGDKILLSVGKNDARCQIFELKEGDLNL